MALDQSHDWPPDNTCLGSQQLVPHHNTDALIVNCGIWTMQDDAQSVIYSTATRWYPDFKSPSKLYLQMDVLHAWQNLETAIVLFCFVLIAFLSRLFQIIRVGLSNLAGIYVFRID